MFGNCCGFLFQWCCLCVLLLFHGFINGQVPTKLENKLLCIEHEECGPCLAAAAHCRWCADPYLKSQAPRCNDDESLVAAGCSQGSIQRPEPAIWEVSENDTLQDLQPGAVPDKVVQIQPQRVRLSLKPRETQTVKFTYRPARNYPLDLYYLMDLTWSMKDDKETLVSLRDDLPVMLSNLTDNFRLGFGSFAEKPLMPYISMDPRRRANPCTVEEEACEATYSYHHHLSLTSQVSDFIEYVNRSSVTANLDNAEAQLDALVQALSCGDKIGWAAHSRKIVMILSDGLMHTAGDGILGGATRKNDEMCHLDDNGYYYQADIYDYPSVAQVYRLLDKYKVNVIFAVTESVKDHYDNLHNLLEDFTYVAKLESDSSNVLKLVKTGYDDIVSVVSFEDDADADKGPVKVKYFSDCGVKGGPMLEAQRCTGVEFGMTLNCEARVTLDACPEYKKSTQTIKISESQLGQDSLSLEVEIQCGCRCQDDVPRDDLDITCGPNQNLVCGVCLCNKGWQGPNCDCSIEDEAASAALEAQCREPNVTRVIACSGAGDCLCGRCDCDRGYNGRYCQCRDCPINVDAGLECGGIGRGLCDCGRCVCSPGWSGEACDCTDSTDTCVAPADDQVCSGHGDCRCGKCECTLSGGVKYTGAFCESCPSCENPLCATTEPCVACHLNSSCSQLCVVGQANYTVTQRMDDRVPENAAATTCILRQYEDGQECEYKYTYTAGTQAMVAMEIVIRSKECYQPTSAKIMTSALVIIACVIAAGIVVILGVKSAHIIADRRAYAKFEKEVMESKKNNQQMNPLYISPISEFKMPEAYNRDKFD